MFMSNSHPASPFLVVLRRHADAHAAANKSRLISCSITIGMTPRERRDPSMKS
jgi:hypothetical protein